MIDLEILHLEEQCTGCAACYNICQNNAIQMLENEEGFYFPVVDNNKCINCKQCENVCPVLNKSNKTNKKEYTAYYGWSNNNLIRKNSSSGGFFYHLAQFIISKNGVVYGAAFNFKTHRLEHKSTDEVDLIQLQKSKYVQSYIGDSYKKIKQDLNNKRQVLFVGTPCQVAGLNFFLHKEYKNLLTCDFICHGVPPMKLLNQHIKYLGFKLDEISNIDFRYKENSWVDKFIIKGKNKYKKHWSYDAYYLGFEKNINLRKSCYTCAYANGNRYADFTIADFWGVYKYDSSKYNKKGLSLILINNKKANDIINQLKINKRFTLLPIDNKYAEYVYSKKREENPKYNKILRDDFFENIRKNGYKKGIKNFGLITPKIKIIKFQLKNKIKKILNYNQ